MANPVLTPKAFEKSGLGQYAGQVMTKEGTANSIAVLFGVCAISAFFGWQAVDPTGLGGGGAWLMPAGIVAFVLAIAITFKQHLAMPLGIGYAVVKGAFVGGLSHLYNDTYPGLPLQALLATGCVFAVMWGLWRGGIIKVTERFRSVVMAATMGVALMYLGSFIASFFTNVSFLSSSSGLGIALSVGVAALAAFNLCLDFDLIEKGIEHRAPVYMQWYAGFGLLVTVVWLYIEILRLLSKLQKR
jgi:uncharacterized YccA/Bax inhibitor family protein